MRRRTLLAVVSVASLAGCSNTGSEDEGRLDLTVQNEGSDPVTARVVVEGDDGTTYEDESDQIDPGVARSFQVTVGTEGRHTATVTGEDWEGQLAWDPSVCASYDGTIRVSGEQLSVLGECADPR